MKIFQVEVGVLWDDCDQVHYNNVYDHLHGYYYENIFYTNSLNNAKQYVIDYVTKGIDNTYGIISAKITDRKFTQKELNEMSNDIDFSNFTVDNIVYNVVKQNNQLIFNFVDLTVNKLYDAYKKDWCATRNISIDEIDEEIGVNGEIYVCFDEFLTNEFQNKTYMNELTEHYCKS